MFFRMVWFLCMVWWFGVVMPRAVFAHPPTSRPAPKRAVPEPPSKRKRPEPPEFSSETRGRAFRAPTAAAGEVKAPQLQTYARSQAADLLQATPGLYMSQHTGRGKAHQFFLRGFDAVHGSDLEIRVEGIPINEIANIHGQGYADINFLMPSVMQRLRYAKGPFLGEQGDFATTGTLNIGLGLAQRGLTVEGGLGSFWQRELALSWGPRDLGEKSFVAAQFSQGDGYGQNRGWLEGRAMAQVELPIERYKLRLLVAAHYGRFESAGVLRERDVVSGAVGLYDAQRAGLGGHSGRFLAQAALSWRDEGQAREVMLYVMGRDLRLKENFTGYLNDAQGDTFEQLHGFVQAGGKATWEHRWIWWERLQRLQMGAELRFDRIEQSQHRLTDADIRYKTEIDAQVQAYQVAAWGTWSLRFLPWLRWRVALRTTLLGMAVDDQVVTLPRPPSRDGVGVQLSPRSTLQFLLPKGWQLFLSYGMGYRSPQARSLRDGERIPFQEAHSAEVGTRYALRGWMEASLAVFGTYLAQELIFDHATATNLYAGPSWRFGAELDLRVRLGLRGLWLDTSISYTEGRFATTWEPVPYAPRLLTRHGIVYRWRSASRFWKVMVALRASFLGPRFLPFGFEGDPIFLLHAVAQVHIGPVFVRLDANNLLNQEWKDGQFVYSSAFEKGQAPQKLPQLHFTAGEPFRIYGTLGVRFF
ncbi:MAG: TonB-dependent receptor [Myxococcales bacterium]|nr:TonB-dependent receptor [Myxococcales bacterium]MCB9641571.1 TonB-dependent receptor [Myxococcales bacterium]